jgi:ABC-type multidrug transport system fused ATPase/permease subunit
VDPAVAVWNRSMHENLTYGHDGTADVAAAIEDADLAGVVSRLPNGLDEPLGEGGGLLSGGEAQRVRLARARLRPNVRLAVLDEPFRGLDRGQRRSLLERCQRWWPAATVVLVTHDVADTDGFDRVLVIESGQVVEDGTPADLAGRDGSRYQALLQAQQDTLLASEVWRRLRVENGKLTAAELQR